QLAETRSGPLGATSVRLRAKRQMKPNFPVSVGFTLVLGLVWASLCKPYQQGDTIASIKGKPKPSKSAAKPSKPARSAPKHPTHPPPTSPPKPATPPGPAAITVSRLGQGQYKSISEAIKAAKPGTQIRVGSGIYSESLLLDKPVEIGPADSAGEVIVEST